MANAWEKQSPKFNAALARPLPQVSKASIARSARLASTTPSDSPKELQARSNSARVQPNRPIRTNAVSTRATGVASTCSAWSIACRTAGPCGPRVSSSTIADVSMAIAVNGEGRPVRRDRHGRPAAPAQPRSAATCDASRCRQAHGRAVHAGAYPVPPCHVRSALARRRSQPPPKWSSRGPWQAFAPLFLLENWRWLSYRCLYILAETMVKAQARGENVSQLIMTPPSPYDGDAS